jgi:hypothetical protein
LLHLPDASKNEVHGEQVIEPSVPHQPTSELPAQRAESSFATLDTELGQSCPRHRGKIVTATDLNLDLDACSTTGVETISGIATVTSLPL